MSFTLLTIVCVCDLFPRSSARTRGRQRRLEYEQQKILEKNDRGGANAPVAAGLPSSDADHKAGAANHHSKALAAARAATGGSFEEVALEVDDDYSSDSDADAEGISTFSCINVLQILCYQSFFEYISFFVDLPAIRALYHGLLACCWCKPGPYLRLFHVKIAIVSFHILLLFSKIVNLNLQSMYIVFFSTGKNIQYRVKALKISRNGAVVKVGKIFWG